MGTIVVGIADTATSQHAAAVAASIAKAMGDELCVVTAYGEDVVETVSAGTDSFVVSTAEAAASLAQNLADRLRQSEGVAATFASRRGKPADVLIDVARETDARLIVVGNVRMQGMARVLGSVANTVAHTAPCDVYIVKTT